MERYRSKGSIGLIVPPRCNETVLEEAFRIRPPGLTWCVASLGMPELTESDFDRALEMTETAAKELVLRKVSVIVQTGMPLQVARGPKYYLELTARLQAVVGSGIPVQTDGGLVIQALRALGAKRVSFISPYQKKIMDNAVRMLEGNGFEVVSAKGEELRLPDLITELHFDSAYEKAIASFQEQPNTDAFYLSCPQWPIVDSIERIERETGKPVVTQLSAILWWTLGTLRLPDLISGYGRLFKRPLAEPSKVA